MDDAIAARKARMDFYMDEVFSSAKAIARYEDPRDWPLSEQDVMFRRLAWERFHEVRRLIGGMVV